MSLEIDLLGIPAVALDGRPAVPPRGRKPWALLAYLVLTAAAPGRERLASLLFTEADDPLGAVRWNLAELRRLLGTGVELGGDPVQLTLPRAAVVDVRILPSATWLEGIRVPGLGRDLLEGIEVREAPAFETWLLAERQRFAGISASILREAATARLASGDARSAVELAARLVAIDDLDEEAHALLVRAYAAAGDIGRAQQQLRASLAHFRTELGIEPSATLVRALEHAPAARVGGISLSSPGTAALVDAGRAAVNAGAVDAGLGTIRLAVSEARSAGNSTLEARAFLALGVALVHGVRGRDGEGATALHAALGIADRLDDPTVGSEAARELGYIEFLRARYDRAETWLRRAIESAPDDAERASAQGVLGAVTFDVGQTGAAVTVLREAAAIGRRTDRPRVEGWAQSFLGRAHLLRGELDLARPALDRALEICRTSGWMSFEPFPMALRATLALEEGDVGAASDAFEAAFAIGCQIGDPCWEGMGARGIGLVRIARGEVNDGIAWLDDARTRCVRIPDAYLWIHAYCLDALCEAGVRFARPEARRWITDLETLASRAGMRAMLVRAHLLRAALGEAGAADAARLFAMEVDDPVLANAVAIAALPA